MQKNYFDLTENQITKLKSRLKRLLRQYDGNEDSFSRIQDTIFACYSEKHRKYHNLHHIHTLLNFADSYKNKINDFSSVSFAIWFHDVVYDTKRDDNEDKSADFALKILNQLKADDALAEKVAAMIRTTKDHKHRCKTDDSEFFTDSDLSILGTSPCVYAEYADAIRQEYSWVPDVVYKKERKKILGSFLNRDRIYSTEIMRNQFEIQARENMANELKVL